METLAYWVIGGAIIAGLAVGFYKMVVKMISGDD